jgi:hypothetical protein
MAAIAKNGGTATINITSNIKVSAEDVILSGGVAAITTTRNAGADDFASGNSGAAAINLQQGVSVIAVKNVGLNVANNGLRTFHATHSSSGATGTASSVLAGAAIIANGVDAVASQLVANHAGKATLTVATDVNVKAGSSVVLLAGSDSHVSNAIATMQAGGGVAADVSEFTGVGGGTATLTATAGVHVTATKGSVALIASAIGSSHFGSASRGVQIKGGSGAAANIDISAAAGGKATVTAAAGVTVTAGDGIFMEGEFNKVQIQGGDFVGGSASVNALAAGAAATLTANASVTLTAADGVGIGSSANPVGRLSIAGGQFVGGQSSAVIHREFAFGKGAKTTINDNAGVSITTTATNKKDATVGDMSIAALTADIGGGLGVGSSGHIFGLSSGNVTANYNAGVTLKAASNLFFSDETITLHGGDRGGGSARASNHGVVSVTGVSALNITAGKAFTIGANSVAIQGGNSAGFAGAGVDGGTATEKLDQSVNITAGTVSATAGNGALFIQGGNSHFIGADSFPSGNSTAVHYTAGKYTGSFNAGVNIKSAGDVTLQASGSSSSGLPGQVGISAGKGNAEFVGKIQTVFGTQGVTWQGGTVTVSGNAGVAIAAGGALHINTQKDLTVAGMFAHNIPHFSSSGAITSSTIVANQGLVGGGSSHAVAKVSLLGNVSLTAKTDVDLNIGGNASVVGGAASNFRANHTLGNVTVLGSADATIHAGRDVNLDISGSLTIAGQNVNHSHAGSFLADGHADEGTVSATAHGDASISAVRNIGSVSSGGHFVAGAVGGNLNVVGGQFIRVAAIGGATNEKALATGNATLVAGGSLNIAVSNDLNVLGGLNGSLETKGSGSHASRAHTRGAVVQAKATLSAGKGLTLSVGGGGFVAGGDSLQVVVDDSNAAMTATGSADVSATIKGGTVSITVIHDFFMRGGGSGAATASGSRGLDKATATGNADAAITATGALSLSVNTSNDSGTQSFIGGNFDKAQAFAFGSNNVATAAMHADVLLTAGGAMTVTAKGNLKVASGPGGESGGLVLAGLASSVAPSFGLSSAIRVLRDKAIGTQTAGVSFTAGTNLTVSTTGGLIINGGSHVASGAFVQAIGSGDTAILTANDNVVMKATRGALSVTAGTAPAITTQPSGSIFIAASSGFGGSSRDVASAKLNGSVTLTGKTTVTVTPAAVLSSGGTGSVNSLSLYNGTINIGVNLPTSAVSPRGIAPMARVFKAYGTESLAPSLDVSSFGQPQRVGLMPTVNITAPAEVAPAVSDGGVQLVSDISDLGTLQSHSLVTSLVTLMGAPLKIEATAFTPLVSLAAFPASCAVLVQSADGQGSCRVGGR